MYGGSSETAGWRRGCRPGSSTILGIVNVTLNLFGVAQHVVFCIKAAQISVRQVDKTQNERSTLK